MKKIKITYWTTTAIIFLFEGIMPALTGHTELAKEGIRHLGYPEYFGTMLIAFKILGTLAIAIPVVPSRIKEWAYFGLGINMICAFISHWVVDGFNAVTVFPLIILAILTASYVCYHALAKNKLRTSADFDAFALS